MQMKVICAWCWKEMSQRECKDFNPPDARFLVSHGICNECKEKVLAAIEKALGEETKTN